MHTALMCGHEVFNGHLYFFEPCLALKIQCVSLLVHFGMHKMVTLIGTRCIHCVAAAAEPSCIIITRLFAYVYGLIIIKMRL